MTAKPPAPGGVELPHSLYRQFAALVYQAAGISLGDAKVELVRSRLIKRLRILQLPDFKAYYDLVKNHDPQGNEMVMLIDAISTNKTDFFRENQHFVFLAEEIFPTLVEQARSNGRGRIRIWSAGCSSGEEPYTLALVLRDALGAQSNGIDAKILATDISTKVLASAQEGIYEESKVLPVPPKYKNLGFAKERSPKGNVYRIRPEVKSLITFRRLNLMSPEFPFRGLFDVIFCRNVMIYFDKSTQESLVNKFHRYLHPGGHLFIGHSESLNGLNVPFQFVRPTIYRKR